MRSSSLKRLLVSIFFFIATIKRWWNPQRYTEMQVKISNFHNFHDDWAKSETYYSLVPRPLEFSAIKFRCTFHNIKRRRKNEIHSTCVEIVKLYAPVKYLAFHWCKWYFVTLEKLAQLISKDFFYTQFFFIICEILCSNKVLRYKHETACCIYSIFVILYF